MSDPPPRAGFLRRGSALSVAIARLLLDAPAPPDLREAGLIVCLVVGVVLVSGWTAFCMDRCRGARLGAALDHPPAPPPLVARLREGPLRCAFCRQASDSTIQRCDSCGVLLHEACAAELLGCPTLGCARAAPRPARPTLTASP
ncbi:MAG: hypothetical protein AB7N76_29745 [Planctomycetota bacterium]